MLPAVPKPVWAGLAVAFSMLKGPTVEEVGRVAPEAW